MKIKALKGIQENEVTHFSINFHQKQIENESPIPCNPLKYKGNYKITHLLSKVDRFSRLLYKRIKSNKSDTIKKQIKSNKIIKLN